MIKDAAPGYGWYDMNPPPQRYSGPKYADAHVLNGTKQFEINIQRQYKNGNQQ